MTKKFLLLISLIILHLSIIAQKKIERADEYYSNFEFLKAISMYQKVIKKDSSNTYAMHQVAKSYQWIGKDELANEWYALLLENDPTNLDARLEYALTLLSKGEYARSKDQFIIYHSLDTTNILVEEYIQYEDFYTELTKDSARTRIEILSINSEGSDYGPNVFKDFLLFTSSRDREVGIKRKNTWSNEPFLDIYRSELYSDGSIGDPELIGEPITSKFHEGSSSYDHMTDQLYFTRTAFYENELNYDDEGVTNIEIFTSRYDEDKDQWLELKTFPYNNKNYSVAQPSISKDGKTLYFVSDMPGGIGGTDIYVCKWNGATWSEPENLGRPVNTERNEKNPYIDKDGILFFASKGHIGLGGLDIYKAVPKGEGFDEPVNLGYPVNTRFDDFSFTFKDDEKQLFYFASNREGGVGEDDIYMGEFIPEEPILLAGNVLIKESLQNTPIKMLITDQSGSLLAADTLNESRPFELPIAEKDQLWNMVFYPLFEMNALESKQGIDPAMAEAGILNVGQIVLGEDIPEDEMEVEGALVISDEGEDPTKDDGSGNVEYIDLPNAEDNIDTSFDPIYFGFDKSNLSDEARNNLDNLIQQMKANPESTVELSGHTDSRGSKTYNLKLSERRTTSALNYLVANGIDASRITTNNYGELQLVNHCEDGVECSNADHASNRRVEIKITKANDL